MLALTVGILALFVGPTLLRAGARSRSIQAGVDGLATVLVLGASTIWLLPHAFAHAGPFALLGLVGGLAVPLALHRLNAERRWMGLGLSVLGVHVVFDGAALAVGGGSSAVVAIAVAAHRVPVGMAVAYQAGSQTRAALALAGLGALTVVGYGIGDSLPFLLSDHAHGVMEAAVVGVLLHVVLGHPPAVPVATPPRFVLASSAPLAATSVSCGPGCTHDHHAHGHGPDEARASASGALVAIALLAIARTVVAPDDGHDSIGAAGQALLDLTLTSAPALLAGFVVAGVVSALLRPGHVSATGRLSQAVRGVLFGLPLPICSCGVVPMYQTLIRRGVPLTAALAFLVATPELGLDALLLSVPLLGVPLTAARVVAAVIVALTVAWWVAGPPSQAPAPPPTETDDTSLSVRLRQGLRYGLVDLVDHTLPWVLLGLGLAALAEPLIDHEALASVPPLLQVPLAAVAGVPLYVCASGATPLAAVAVHKGLSAGAALTFLLAGPASNVTTFGILSQLHGRALAVRFGLVLTATAVVLGWTVDGLGIQVPAVTHPGTLEAHAHGWFAWTCLLALALLALASLFRMGARGVIDQILDPVHDH